MKRTAIIIVATLILSFITISCSKDSVDTGKTLGTLKFEATTTSGGITSLVYIIRDGSIELFNEGPIETNQSQWGISHSANSLNHYIITGTPDSEETLTIKVFFDNVLIGSGSSTNVGQPVVVSGLIP